MRVLIISVTCGEGHNSIARAIKNELTQRNHEAEIIDLYENSKFDQFLNDKAFIFAQKTIPKLYEKIWFMEKKRVPEKRYSGGLQPALKKPKNHILNKIQKYSPDAILCTQSYPSGLINNYIRDGLIPNIKTYTILTDYCVHPYWECSYLLDYIFIPHSSVTDELISRGFSSNQIVVSGIPIHEKFSKNISKAEARSKLKLKDNFTVLIMGGGLGLSNPIKVLKSLTKVTAPINVCVVCGRNEKLFKKLTKFVQKKKLDNFKIYGFVDFIETLMDASDITISRGGATSITEALYKNLPIVFREKLYINEKLNQNLFIENGFGLKLEKDNKADELVLKLINNPKILEEIVEKQKECNKPNAVKIIVDQIENKKHE